MPEPGLAALDDALRDADLVDGVRVDYPVGGLTTYRVGGPAARFVRPANIAELERVALAVTTAAGVGGVLPVLVIGRGSNLLVADRGFDGLVIQLGMGFEEITIDGDVVRAGGAASLPVVARLTVASGLEGFEWAVGVPGSIGGAVRMNAGGHGSDMAAALMSATTVDLQTGLTGTRSVGDLALGYRTSTVTASEVVVAAELRLIVGERSRGEEKLAEVVRWRRANQPGGHNAGSVFANPPGDSAGQLVDTAGGRGLRIGSAEVSVRHANFIQADEGGSAEDVARLMAEVVRLVEEIHGVRLEPETVLVGF